MSVNTAADDALANAKYSVNEAIKELSKILIDECWGHDEYKKEYYEAMNEAFTQLREIKKLLNP